MDAGTLFGEWCFSVLTKTLKPLLRSRCHDYFTFHLASVQSIQGLGLITFLQVWQNFSKTIFTEQEVCLYNTFTLKTKSKRHYFQNYIVVSCTKINFNLKVRNSSSNAKF